MGFTHPPLRKPSDKLQAPGAREACSPKGRESHSLRMTGVGSCLQPWQQAAFPVTGAGSSCQHPAWHTPRLGPHRLPVSSETELAHLTGSAAAHTQHPQKAQLLPLLTQALLAFLAMNKSVPLIHSRLRQFQGEARNGSSPAHVCFKQRIQNKMTKWQAMRHTITFNGRKGLTSENNLEGIPSFPPSSIHTNSQLAPRQKGAVCFIF